MGSPHLYQTDPSGSYSEWVANATGRNSKSVMEYLEKKHDQIKELESQKCIDMAIKALMEVVQPDGKNMEVVAMRRGEPLTVFSEAEINAFIKRVEVETEAE